MKVLSKILEFVNNIDLSKAAATTAQSLTTITKIMAEVFSQNSNGFGAFPTDEYLSTAFNVMDSLVHKSDAFGMASLSEEFNDNFLETMSALYKKYGLRYNQTSDEIKAAAEAAATDNNNEGRRL